MNLITKDTDYALRVLCFIAKKKRQIFSANDLVEKLKIPKPFLRKILQKLNKKGVLTSHKGKGGGFILKASPRKISVLDIINIFQGSLKLQEHTFKKEICPNVKKCLLKKHLDIINKFAVNDLKSVTIGGLK